MLRNTFFIITFIVFFAIVSWSCRDCYICKANRMVDNLMVDFEKECGSKEEKEAMEQEFKEKYPDSLGFLVVCN